MICLLYSRCERVIDVVSFCVEQASASWFVCSCIVYDIIRVYKKYNCYTAIAIVALFQLGK